MSAMGVLLPFLIGNPLVALFSAFCSQARSPIADENYRSPRLSLNLLSLAFLPRSVANELRSVFLASGLLNCGRKSKKSFPAIGRDDYVLSLKDISVILPSVN